MQSPEFDNRSPRFVRLPVGRGRSLQAGVMCLLAVVARFSNLADTPQIRSETVATLRNPGGQSGGAIGDAERRVQRIGQHLLRSLPAATADPVQFHVVRGGDLERRSWSDPRGGVFLTQTLVEALPDDAWVATLLSYEVGGVFLGQSRLAEAEMDAFVVDLMRSAGFDAQVVADMHEWIVTSTSRRPAVVDERVMADFGQRIAQLVDSGAASPTATRRNP